MVGSGRRTTPRAGVPAARIGSIRFFAIASERAHASVSLVGCVALRTTLL